MEADDQQTTTSSTKTIQLSDADSLYINEQYQSAITEYTNFLQLQPQPSSIQQFRALSHRAQSHIRLSQYAPALRDAKAALELLSSSSSSSDDLVLMKGEEEGCRLRLGIAAMEEGCYEEAMNALESGRNLCLERGGDEENDRFEVWLEKCRKKMSAKDEEEEEEEVIVEVVDRKESQEPPPSQPPPPAVKSKPSVLLPSKKIPSMPKYQYYQNDSTVTVAILEHNVQREDVDAEFGLDTLTVRLTKGGVNFTVIRGKLYDGVNVDKCKVKVMDEKVLIKLRKREKKEWNELFGDGVKTDTKKKVQEKETPLVEDESKPRPYASHRDWNAIERDLKEKEKEEKPEGDEALNSLFRDIYGKASDETKRAMVKSFQTSGGTVLSTNWDEVSKTDYEKERTAPKGVEWKNWEGDKLPQKDD